MKLKNKKTGEIIETDYKLSISIPNSETLYGYKTYDELKGYNSLAELNADWEDVPEEPKKYWFIDAYGNIVQNEITKHYCDEYTDMTDAYESQKQIGNWFETKEEAEEAVEKLKAWKRLKDKGFTFYDWVWDYMPIQGLKITASIAFLDGIEEDLDLLLRTQENR